MPSTCPLILITRPEPQATEFAKTVRELLGTKAEVLIAPLTQVTPTQVDWRGEETETLILTSRNAVRFAAPFAPGQRAVCVGDRTTASASAAGLSAACGGRTASELLRHILEGNAGPGPFHYLRGETVSTDLAGALSGHGLPVRQTVVYRQGPLKPGPAVKDSLMDASTILIPVFSAMGGQRIAEELSDLSSKIRLVPLSKNIADMAELKRFSMGDIADAPTADAMARALTMQL